MIQWIKRDEEDLNTVNQKKCQPFFSSLSPWKWKRGADDDDSLSSISSPLLRFINEWTARGRNTDSVGIQTRRFLPRSPFSCASILYTGTQSHGELARHDLNCSRTLDGRRSTRRVTRGKKGKGRREKLNNSSSRRAKDGAPSFDSLMKLETRQMERVTFEENFFATFFPLFRWKRFPNENSQLLRNYFYSSFRILTASN